MPIASINLFIASLEHIIGFGMVMVVLAVLWGLTAAIGTCFIRSAGPARAVAAPQGTVGDELSEEEVAAITACVVTLMGRRSRIVSIRSSAKDWSREGRREHFASHRIR